MSEQDLGHVIEAIDAEIELTWDILDTLDEVVDNVEHEKLVRSLDNLNKQRRELLA